MDALYDYLPALLFLALTIFLMAGFPVAFTLAGAAILFGLIGDLGWDFFSLLPSRVYGWMTNLALLAVPLFIFMGVMLEKSGLAEKLLDTMGLLMGNLRGGLAVSVVLVGALLGASTGIVGATVVTMGLLAVPTMLKWGYQKELATGAVAASGTLGQIIPPSIVLILVGDIVGVPAGELFMGAVFPGLILVALYVGYILTASFARPEIAPPIPEEIRASISNKQLIIQTFKALIPPLAIITAVLGSIFAGIASPTESAAVGAAGACVLAALNRKLNIKILREVMTATTELTSMVFIILCGAGAFSLVFRGLGGDELIRGFLIDMSGIMGKQSILIVVLAVIFLAGFILDFVEIIFILVPVLAPIMADFGFNPLWFCVVLAVNLQTSFITPPFGFSLFYLNGVAPPSVKTADIYRGIIPFVLLQLAGLAIIIIFPQLTTWLPGVVFNR